MALRYPGGCERAMPRITRPGTPTLDTRNKGRRFASSAYSPLKYVFITKYLSSPLQPLHPRARRLVTHAMLAKAQTEPRGSRDSQDRQLRDVQRFIPAPRGAPQPPAQTQLPIVPPNQPLQKFWPRGLIPLQIQVSIKNEFLKCSAKQAKSQIAL